MATDCIFGVIQDHLGGDYDAARRALETFYGARIRTVGQCLGHPDGELQYNPNSEPGDEIYWYPVREADVPGILSDQRLSRVLRSPVGATANREYPDTTSTAIPHISRDSRE
jgi:hypothetical protein